MLTNFHLLYCRCFERKNMKNSIYRFNVKLQKTIKGPFVLKNSSTRIFQRKSFESILGLYLYCNPMQKIRKVFYKACKKEKKKVIPTSFLLRDTVLSYHAIEKWHEKTSILLILNKYKHYNKKIKTFEIKFRRRGSQ